MAIVFQDYSLIYFAEKPIQSAAHRNAASQVFLADEPLLFTRPIDPFDQFPHGGNALPLPIDLSARAVGGNIQFVRSCEPKLPDQALRQIRTVEQKHQNRS